jgi:hypothetical protein
MLFTYDYTEVYTISSLFQASKAISYTFGSADFSYTIGSL